MLTDDLPRLDHAAAGGDHGVSDLLASLAVLHRAAEDRRQTSSASPPGLGEAGSCERTSKPVDFMTPPPQTSSDVHQAHFSLSSVIVSVLICSMTPRVFRSVETDADLGSASNYLRVKSIEMN